MEGLTGQKRWSGLFPCSSQNHRVSEWFGMFKPMQFLLGCVFHGKQEEDQATAQLTPHSLVPFKQINLILLPSGTKEPTGDTGQFILPETVSKKKKFCWEKEAGLIFLLSSQH